MKENSSKIKIMPMVKFYIIKFYIMANMFITDFYGYQIEVTDLDKAIEQAEFCSDSPYIMTHYSSHERKIIPEDKRITIGEYYQDVLTKLKSLTKKAR